jgi:toxin HigB-1
MREFAANSLIKAYRLNLFTLFKTSWWARRVPRHLSPPTPVIYRLTLSRKALHYSMIRSYRHKGLKELFEKGSTARIQKPLQERCLRRLDALDRAARAEDMNLHGFDFHALHGKPQRYTVHVNGPWCITFEFEGGDAYRVDFEQYH